MNPQDNNSEKVVMVGNTPVQDLRTNDSTECAIVPMHVLKELVDGLLLAPLNNIAISFRKKLQAKENDFTHITEYLNMLEQEIEFYHVIETVQNSELTSNEINNLPSVKSY